MNTLNTFHPIVLTFDSYYTQLQRRLSKWVSGIKRASISLCCGKVCLSKWKLSVFWLNSIRQQVVKVKIEWRCENRVMNLVELEYSDKSLTIQPKASGGRIKSNKHLNRDEWSSWPSRPYVWLRRQFINISVESVRVCACIRPKCDRQKRKRDYAGLLGRQHFVWNSFTICADCVVLTKRVFYYWVARRHQISTLFGLKDHGQIRFEGFLSVAASKYQLRTV